MERNIYLQNTELEEALALYLERLKPLLQQVGTEEADVRDSVGRVLAEPVFARYSSPNYNGAAMDGIMVRSEATDRASEAQPVILQQGRDFAYVNTGQQVFSPYNSVIMIEDVVPEDPTEAFGSLRDRETGEADLSRALRILAPAPPWQHIRPVGEDIAAGGMILPENHQIRPMDIGAVLSGGVTRIKVYQKIRVGILPTGTEITGDYDFLEEGKVFDSNSWTFRAMAMELGCTAERLHPIPDEYEKLKEAMLDLAERCHIVLVSAGSSAGSRDYTAAMVKEAGELVLHGIAMKPGKPTILGIVKGSAVIGLPGYPGAAFLAFEEIVSPVIKAFQRKNQGGHAYAEAILSRRIISSLKYREYVRVKLGKVGDRLIATPLAGGAGITMSLVRSDGLLVVPRNSEGYEAGEKAQVELTRNIREIENTLVSIGSQDMMMDFVASLMEKEEGGVHLSSAHVGSMGGILALRRGEAHLAPIHLLDEETGEYNSSYIKRYLGEDCVLVKGVTRAQGLILPPGNPKAVRSLQEVVTGDLVFANRQKGSGTRVLADHLFHSINVDPEKLRGYFHEFTTHMAVAAAVKSGAADVGLGAFSAAKVMGLDFLFLADEEYDFAVARAYLDMPAMQTFFRVLRSDALKKILCQLGGYGNLHQ